MFDAPLTVAWVLVVVNAINLIDGLDGLAAGVVLIASTALWWVARGHADFYVMFFASLLIGAALGFLRYNFPPARIFMGDTGSQFLGLTFAALSLLENRKGTAAVTLLLHRQAELTMGYDTLAKELAKQAAAPMTAKRVAEAVMTVRRARLPDPAQLGNAGSFFKNPVVSAELAQRLRADYPGLPSYPQPDGSCKLAAGWLIEQAGMKGITLGRAGTHEQQALVLVNRGGATGAELLAVARAVRDAVLQKFAVHLEPEVWIVGASL